MSVSDSSSNSSLEFGSDKKKIRMERSVSPDLFDDSTESEEVSITSQITWRGTPLLSFTRLSPTNLNVPPVVPTPEHNVYIKLPVSVPLDPYPDQYTDVWSGSYVRMPNSPESLYPVQTENGKSKIVKRWSVIQESLQKKIMCVQDFKEAVLSYNHRYEDKWKFYGLKFLLEEDFIDEERSFFFETLLPKIIKLALDLPQILTRPVCLLKKKCTKSVTLSQKQIASLLANAFLCTFPRRNAKGSQTEYASYPDINFNRLYFHMEKRAREKLKCIINYFKEVTSREFDGVITFTRQHYNEDDMPEFQTSSAPLTRLHTNSVGLIEDARGLLQVDFANKFIGGGVLGLGCVQEEIRFVICPELLVARLFTEVLDKHEALIITGVEQYSECKGYSSNFEWVGPYRDKTPRDNYGRRLCQVVALDALHFTKNPSLQYKPSFIHRELRKAYVGFQPLNGSKGKNIAVASGSWGCGAFRGDPRLKGLIQIAAASLVGRDLAYFTFGDKDLRDDLADVHHFLIEEGITVGQLVMVLCQFGMRENIVGKDLLSYIYTSLSHYDSETDSEENQLKIKPKKIETSNISQESKNNSVDNENKKAVRSITDYFKPVSKSVVATNEYSSYEGNSSKATPLVTEDKILKALNECNQLVRNAEKMTENKNRVKESKSEESIQCRNEEALIASNSNINNNNNSLSLFERLDTIDRNLT